jgi:chemotaxis protein CheD
MTALPEPQSRQRKFLHPGHLLVSATPISVTTILGSCVAVCLWDAQKQVGGINHFMLPLIPSEGAASARFGDVAMQELVEKMRVAGARLPFIHAGVFGGSCMFAGMQTEAHLGAKNVEVAITFLKRRGIDITREDVGGNRGRKLTFDMETGAVCLNMI